MVCVCAIEFCVRGACENVEGINSRKSVHGRQQNVTSHDTSDRLKSVCAFV